MTINELSKEGWELFKGKSENFYRVDHEIFTKGEPFKDNCLWFTRTTGNNTPKIELQDNKRMLVKGCLQLDTIEDFKFLLSKTIGA